MLSDKEWEEFLIWCKEQWPMWAPDRTTLRLYLVYLEDKKKKED